MSKSQIPAMAQIFCPRSRFGKSRNETRSEAESEITGQVFAKCDLIVVKVIIFLITGKCHSAETRWLKDFFMLGLKDRVTPDEIFATNKDLLAKENGHMFEKWWDEELERPNPSMMRVLCKGYGWPVMIYSLMFSMTETFMR